MRIQKNQENQVETLAGEFQYVNMGKVIEMNDYVVYRFRSVFRNSLKRFDVGCFGTEAVNFSKICGKTYRNNRDKDISL